MTRERLWLYDTTLRDGQQTQGVYFSAEDKARIARGLDALGIDYVEGGWPRWGGPRGRGGRGPTTRCWRR
jgi:2-isopropylmalate synthase